MSRSRLSFISTALVAIVLLAAPPLWSMDLRDLLGAPNAGQLTASANGEQLAFSVYQGGLRNIWLADAPSYKARQLTSYNKDDGQRIGDLQFTADGRYLLYTRGNAEGANPASDPTFPAQTIRVIDLASGEDREFGPGGAVVASPVDRRFLYSSNQQLMIAELDWTALAQDAATEGAQPPGQILFKARGSSAQYRWSPDGDRVAFTSNRGGHSFIGVFDLGEQQIRWIAPSVDMDMHPRWSPDGTRLSFLRSPGLMKDQYPGVMDERSASLWVADPKSGEAREIWSPPAPNGAFAQTYPDEPLTWAGNDRLVFFSEHDGWMRIYGIDADGDNLTALTPASCEAENSAVNQDGRSLYFSSNCNAGDALDIDRRHLWRADTRNGQPKPLTRGTGIETHPVPLAGSGRVAYHSAGVRYPTGIALMDVHGRQQERVFPSSLPAVYPADELIEPQQVVFQAADGVTVHGQLFMPPDAKAGDQRPALLFMHGGPIRQMLLGYHYRGEYYAFTYAMNQYLANRGYVVMSVNFRAGIGYGREFRAVPDQGPRGASEYQDILAAGKYLQNMSQVDPRRIGLWGGSYGGTLTAMGLARDSSLFAAGVDIHGVHDWAWRGRDFGNAGWWNLTPETFDEAHRSSAVSDLTFWSSPVLLVHGDDDRNVMFAQTVDLAQRLRQRNVEVEVLVFPDEVHSFLRHEVWLRTLGATEEFFSRHLERQ